MVIAPGGGRMTLAYLDWGTTKVTDIAKRARPQDTLVVYQSGHGVAIGQRFYLIPHDFKARAAATEPAPAPTAVASRGYAPATGREAAIRARGLAVDDLGEALAAVSALRRVLIFDTCHSGGAAAWPGPAGIRSRSAARWSDSPALRECTC